MNPETLRCRILDYTKREVYQHGTDGLTVDDTARGVKMSKQTLCKLLPDKTNLFRVCLSDFANGIRGRIQQKQIRMDGSYMEAFFITVDGYLILFHLLGRKSLMDTAADREYRAAFKRGEAFQLQQLIDILTHCKICGYLLPGINPDRFIPGLQEATHQSSLQGAPYLVQRMLNYTFLRGFFKMGGIHYIGEHLKSDSLNACV